VYSQQIRERAGNQASCGTCLVLRQTSLVPIKSRMNGLKSPFQTNKFSLKSISDKLTFIHACVHVGYKIDLKDMKKWNYPNFTKAEKTCRVW
jgi:hypothetical protein